ncbi:hypothetical protein KEM48_013655 [Puccinia striiformis f. sp. tritici PST-130]|nr:hypothetical protein KEM48_013655 [Puccinia striiformis f. sp. tritici PST-130]
MSQEQQQQEKDRQAGRLTSSRLRLIICTSKRSTKHTASKLTTTSSYTSSNNSHLSAKTSASSTIQTYYDPLQQFNLLNQFSPSPLASQFELFSSYNPSLQQLQYYDPFSPGIAQLHQQQQIQAAPYHQEPFFYDQEPLPQEILQASQLAQLSTIPQYQYSSQARQVLGTRTEDKALHPLEIRRCFNCGDSSHALIGCPEARNEPLIRLTKQIFQAHTNSNQPENGGPDDEQGQQHEEKHRTSS